MKRMKWIFLVAIAAFAFSPAAQAQKVMVTSTLQNFELTQFNCGCPSYGGDPAFAISLNNLELTDKEADKLMELVSAFENANGVQVSGGSKTKNFQLTGDKVKTTATGPLKGPGKALCDFVKSLM